jgi:hypothetical protein
VTRQEAIALGERIQQETGYEFLIERIGRDAIGWYARMYRVMPSGRTEEFTFFDPDQREGYKARSWTNHRVPERTDR